MALLEFARGPALIFSLVVLVLGCAWRLAGIYRLASPKDLSEPRSKALAAGALRDIVSRMWQPRTFRQRTKVSMATGYAYHLGLAIVVFGFVPHIAFVQRLTGLHWPALPGWLFIVGVLMTFMGLLYALMARLTSRVLRLISNFDDYASWVVTMLPMLTGMGVLRLSLDAHYPLKPDIPIAVAIHLLSLELLLVWLPFGKLSHAFLVFFSRATTGAAFARKGARP